jgi:hypothetical protein
MLGVWLGMPPLHFLCRYDTACHDYQQFHCEPTTVIILLPISIPLAQPSAFSHGISDGITMVQADFCDTLATGLSV